MARSIFMTMGYYLRFGLQSVNVSITLIMLGWAVGTEFAIEFTVERFKAIYCGLEKEDEHSVVGAVWELTYL